LSLEAVAALFFASYGCSSHVLAAHLPDGASLPYAFDASSSFALLLECRVLALPIACSVETILRALVTLWKNPEVEGEYELKMNRI
jgi:hypothetical protein